MNKQQDISAFKKRTAKSLTTKAPTISDKDKHRAIIAAQTAVYELTNTIEVLPTLPISYMGKANSNVSQADVRG